MKLAVLASVFVLGFASSAQAQDFQNATTSTEIQAGRKALEGGHPDQARDHFAAALAYTDAARGDRFAALVGLGRADLWLEDYPAASAAFSQAQALAQDPSDRQAADVGMAKALNATEYYLRAHALAAPYAPGQLEPTIEVLRSEQALAWDDRSVPIIGAAPAASPDDRLGAEYLHLKSETDYRLSDRVDGAFTYSHDSDNLTVYGYELGAWLPGATGGDTFNSWRLSAKTYTVDDGITSDQLTYLGAGTSMRIGDAHHVNVNAGAGMLDGWTFFQGGADWEYRLSDSFGINASADRSPILTTTALADHVLFNTYTIGTSVRPSDHLYVIPTYFHQDFSDGNHRDGASLRLVLSPYDVPDTSSALGAQVYARVFDSSAPGAGVYFNPGTYDLVKFDLIGVHRFSPDWLLRGTAGGGYQSIDGSSGGSYEFELTLSGRLPGNGRLDATLGRSSFASAAGGSSEYWNNTFMISIGYPLG